MNFSSWIPGNPFLLFPKSIKDHLIYPAGLFSYERHALIQYLYFLRECQGREIDTVLVPDYMCHEFVNTLQACHRNVLFYGLDEQMQPDFEALKGLWEVQKSKQCAVVVYHAYGKLVQGVSDIYSFFKDKGVPVLEDMAHLPYPFGRNEGFHADARFYSLRKTYGVPYGAVLETNGLDQEFNDFLLKRPELVRDRGFFRMAGWYVKQFIKEGVVRSRLPYRAGYRDLSHEPLKGFQTGHSFISRLISQADFERAVRIRRENYQKYAAHFEAICEWAEPLEFQADKDVPYQLLLFLKEGLDPLNIIKEFRKMGVAAMTGMALSDSVLKKLPKEHKYHRHIALPLHQDIIHRQIDRVLQICDRFKDCNIS